MLDTSIYEVCCESSGPSLTLESELRQVRKQLYSGIALRQRGSLFEGRNNFLFGKNVPSLKNLLALQGIANFALSHAISSECAVCE